MSLVVDASVALRWYVDAPGSEAAAALLAGKDPLVAPDLVVAEVTNAAWKLARAGEIGGGHGRRISVAVASAFSELVSSARLASRAFDLASDLCHPVYDCLYLALAESADAELVTADRRLADRLEAGAWKGRFRLLTA